MPKIKQYRKQDTLLQLNIQLKIHNQQSVRIIKDCLQVSSTDSYLGEKVTKPKVVDIN